MTLFVPGTPTGFVNLDIDYKTVQNNFTQIATSFAKNHVALTNATASNGKHTFVEMISLKTTFTFVPAGLAAGEGTIFTNTDSSSNVQAFYTDGASGNAYQMTNTSPSKFSTFGNVNYGWTFLPGGLIYNYGFVSTTGSSPSNGQVTFPRPFTSSPNILIYTSAYFNQSSIPSSQATIYIDYRTSGPTAISNTTFNWDLETGSGHVDGFNWFAIGN